MVADSPHPPTDMDAGMLLDYAELALKSGDAQTALTSVGELLHGDRTLDEAQHLRARRISASGLEIITDYGGAIAELEALLSDAPRDLAWIGTAMALCRCYRESGDLPRAIRVGRDSWAEARNQGLAETEEAIRLLVTYAGAHVHAGDLTYALLLCQQAAERADAIDSPLARASANWNASLARSLQGEREAAAVLARRALVDMKQAGDARALGMMHNFLAEALRRLEPPDLDAAEASAQEAARLFAWSDASAAERARATLELGQIAYRRGQWDQARSAAEECLAVVHEVNPGLAGDIWLLLGKVTLATDGDHDVARAQFERSALLLTASGEDLAAAATWGELGTLLEAIGDIRGAIDAYRRAAVSSGVMAEPTPLVEV